MIDNESIRAADAKPPKPMTLTLYSLLLRLLVPGMLLRLLWRSRTNPAYRKNLMQRLAVGLPQVAPSASSVIWVHAVSVGETIAIAPIINAMLAAKSDLHVVVTSTTPTGAEQVRRLFGERVQNLWAPIDTPGAVRRFYACLRPDVVVLVETEIWPNIIHAAKQRRVPIMLANARLSAGSARGYARVSRLSRPALRAFSVIACQQRADVRRFTALGAASQTTIVAGSVKFDLEYARLTTQREMLMSQLGLSPGRLLVLAASTHPGEEAYVIQAFSKLYQRDTRALLIIAPRHPDRVSQIERDVLKPLSADFGGGCYWQRRSDAEPLKDDTPVMILDTLGELSALSGGADIAFVGGSLVAHGGHNPLEAAAFGVPVVTGPHITNFRSIYRELMQEGGALCVSNTAELATTLIELHQDPRRRSAIGEAGKRYVEGNQGALARQVALVNSLLGD